MKEFLNKAKERILENKYILLAFTVVWIAAIVFSLNMYKTTMGMEATGNRISNRVIEVTEGRTIDQTMPAVDGAKSVAIKFATYARKNSGEMTVRVIGNDSGTVYLQNTVKVSDIQDNVYHTFALEKAVDAGKDETLTFELTSNCEKEKGVGVYYSDTDEIEEGKMTVNSIPFRGDLNCKQLAENEYYKKFSSLVITMAIVGCSVLILMLVLGASKQLQFASIVLVFGLLFSAVLTPMSVPDEQFHYECAYQITSNIFGEDHTIMDVTYRNYSHFLGHENSPGAYQRLIEHFNDPLEMKEKYETIVTDIDELSYLVYFFPQTVGVLIGRTLKMNFLRTFYLGRFTNLLFYVFCVYFAIKKTPVHKTLFGLLSCMPMFLQQCCSYSYDSFVNGLCFILFAYFLKWKHDDEQISRREIFGVMLVTLLIAPAKFIYGLFIVPFFFVPKERFGGKKNKIIAMLVISAPVLYMFIYMLLPQIKTLIYRIGKTYSDTSSDGITVKKAGFDLDLKPSWIEDNFDEDKYKGIPTYTIGFIVEYPIHTIMLILRTIRFNLKKWFYDSLGRTLSGASMLIPLRIVHLFAILVVAASLIKEDITMSPLLKLTILAVCVIIALLILLGFLLSWTYKTDTMVQGVQGRYFSPLLPLFFTVFNNKYISIPKKVDRYLIFVQILLLFEVVLYILSFTFVS